MRQVRWIAALALALLAAAAQAQTGQGTSQAGTRPANTLKDVFDKLGRCWKAPVAEGINPMDITVMVSFNRAGEILGHPRITYESAQASDMDRVAYRVAVMETLKRCTPMPLTESMAGAVAGRPLRVEFRNVKPQTEKRAWLSPKTL
jgi:hypothetical protein